MTLRAARAACLAAAAVGFGGLALAPAASAWERMDDVALPSTLGNVDPSTHDLKGLTELRARVLLPDGYDRQPDREWPVVYLLAGAGENYLGWTAASGGNAQTTLAGLDAILVMPEPGRSFFVDWASAPAGGANWMQYYLEEVVPFVEQRYRIKPGRQNHAIGGLSMGGYGGPVLAAALPGYFGNVLSLSGQPLNLRGLDTQAGFVFKDIVGGNLGFETYWGRTTQAFAEVSDPMALTDNLAGTRFYLYSGNGIPDARFGFNFGAWTEGAVAEFASWIQAMDFQNALRRKGAAVTRVQRGGIHGWDYWRREMPLYKAWGPFGAPPVTSSTGPATWSYKTMQPRGNAWGISYRFASRPTGIVTISRSGDVLRATGPASTAIQVATGAEEWDASGAPTRPECTAVVRIPFELTIPEGCR